MTQRPTHHIRLEARIVPDALAVVKRAAEIQGRSISDFVVTAALEAARKTVEETQLVRLSMEDQISFAEAIAKAPEPNDALRRSRDAHRRLLRETR